MMTCEYGIGHEDPGAHETFCLLPRMQMERDQLQDRLNRIERVLPPGDKMIGANYVRAAGGFGPSQHDTYPSSRNPDKEA